MTKTTMVIRDIYGKNSKKEVLRYEEEIPNQQADFAMELLKRWGMVAAVPDGEDTAGRAKLRLATPSELVDRACSVSDLFFKELQSRDWMAKSPSIEEFLS